MFILFHVEIWKITLHRLKTVAQVGLSVKELGSLIKSSVNPQKNV